MLGRMLTSRSPWDLAPVWQSPSATSEQIAGAVAAMAGAFPAWSRNDHRAERLRALATAISAHRASLAVLLTREAGKTAGDAEAEIELLIKKIDITLGAGASLVPGVPAVGHGVAIAWRPRGVAVVVGPSNFPLHLLHGLVVPALAVGCTVVAKPTERCPALGELYRALLREAGLGEVCAVVLGGPEVVADLVAQPAVATVAAVGSRTTGVALSRLLAPRPEVVLALELGGVNHALVCADAEVHLAVPAIADGAWRMAGQRCTATRIVHVPRRLLDPVLAGLHAQQPAWLPSGAHSAQAGPMVAVDLRDRFVAAWQARPDGLEALPIAGSPPSGGAFAAPVLAVVRDPAARHHPLISEEHFGPGLIVDPYDDEDEAVARMTANPYRLSAAVWTTDRERFLRHARLLRYGLVAHNRSTAGARSDLPFGGCGASGNGRPAAVAASRIFADETVVW
ncbi:N-succinylglutamate 5-semialdehyde dehydrogenase [Planctomycetota bacterium]|nr:N-succinylglutamate 5-semialdehyde dehydrogenase [Planctomycetota bacterium]